MYERRKNTLHLKWKTRKLKGHLLRNISEISLFPPVEILLEIQIRGKK